LCSISITCRRHYIGRRAVETSVTSAHDAQIYRCWFLWDRSWLVIALPLLIWLANVATFIRFLVLLSQATQGLIISSAVQPWVRGFWAMTITINVMTTCACLGSCLCQNSLPISVAMIVARIWMVDRQNKKLGIDAHEPRSTLGHAIRNIVESGMIYTAVSLFMLIAVNLKSTLTYPASGLVSWSKSRYIPRKCLIVPCRKFTVSESPSI
jgi:energy-coupling factor transporter transmembrane protein EcfT